MSKQSFPSDAKSMACFYDNIYIQEDGTLNYILSGHVIEDTNVENIAYRILPVEKRNLTMVSDTDYKIISKDEFLEELKGISRRFDSLAYRVEDIQELAKKMRKQNATTVMATVSLEDYKKKA
jgi:DNA-directed RNA polymerase subunit L